MRSSCNLFYKQIIERLLKHGSVKESSSELALTFPTHTNAPPDPVKLRRSGGADKEVYSKKVPVFGDYNQRISGPDETWRRTTGGGDIMLT